MADKKISALPAATTPLAGTEVLPIVQGGTTDQVSVANLTSGRDVDVKKLNATDNIVIGTAGKGIDFSANSHAAGMTSELLTWYEEGVWTPAQGAGLTVVGAFTSAGTYTRIGRMVIIRAKIDGSTSVAAASAAQLVAGLPFAPAADTPGTWFDATLSNGGVIDAAPAGIYSVGAIGATTTIYVSASYMV